jgi:hypothetical protein
LLIEGGRQARGLDDKTSAFLEIAKEKSQETQLEKIAGGHQA